MGKKIEIWILYLTIIFFVIILILFGGVLRNEFNKQPKVRPYPEVIKIGDFYL